MATVQNNSNVASQSLLDAVNGKKNTATSKANDIQDRFMTLLVTQMKNQDPLNPMDNAQVTSQMAQLSTVTGIDKLNSSLAGLMQSVQLGQSYQAAGMIGHHVLSPGNTISNAGKGGVFGVDLPSGADKLTVKVKDAAGGVLRTLNYGTQGTGITPLSWDGLRDDGTPVANGEYKLEVSATVGKSAVTANPLSYTQVLSVSNNAGEIKLNLSNNTSIATGDVREIF